MTQASTRTERIAQLNDRLRRDRLGGHIMMTRGVADLAADDLTALLLALRDFTGFDEGKYPYREHDFGRIAHRGTDYFFKIDTYADASLSTGADDPLSPAAVRVLTLMRADEY